MMTDEDLQASSQYFTYFQMSNWMSELRHYLESGKLHNTFEQGDRLSQKGIIVMIVIVIIILFMYFCIWSFNSKFGMCLTNIYFF